MATRGCHDCSCTTTKLRLLKERMKNKSRVMWRLRIIGTNYVQVLCKCTYICDLSVIVFVTLFDYRREVVPAKSPFHFRIHPHFQVEVGISLYRAAFFHSSFEGHAFFKLKDYVTA